MKYPHIPKTTHLEIIIFSLICLMLLFCLTCCSTIPEAMTALAPTVYKYDIKGSVNGVPFNGVGVIPDASQYQIKIISPVDVDMLTITSCNRDVAIQAAISVGWFESSGGYPYTYAPDPVEKHLGCLIKLGSYNKAHGQNAWGILLPQSQAATLPATVVCNGEIQNVGGVSICQSRVGLKQEIIFSEPVRIFVKAIKPGCVPETQDNLAWTYETALGTCAVDFMTVASPHKIHYLETVGYNEIEVR